MKILVIRLSSIGDIVLAEAVTAMLKERYPQSEIYFLTKREFVNLVTSFSAVDFVLAYEKSFRFHLSIRKHHFDLVLDIHSKLSTLILTTFIRGNIKLRYNKKHLQRKLLVYKLSKKAISSTLDLYLEPLYRSRILTHEHFRYPKLIPQLEVPMIIHHLRDSNPKNQLIALFVGAAHWTKMYPISSWVEVIRNSPLPYRFLLLGSSKDKWLAREIETVVGDRVHNLCGEFSLPELISVLGEVDLVLSNDSGPMHIAAALGKHQIAIFGSTHPSLGFSPLNLKAEVICTSLPCQPCTLHGLDKCPLGHHECMQSIQSIAILDAIQRIENYKG